MDNLRTRLRNFARRWDQIDEIPESPRSLLSVIEHSLGRRRKTEVYVNKMLAYYLDPTEPHGLESRFLRAFLEGLSDVCGFEEDTYDLADVQVDDQVQVGTGLVDLVIRAPHEWFLMIELKFRAAETGTVAYRAADNVGDSPKDDYQSGQYYLYLHHREEPTASEPDFANWTWKEFIDDVVRPFYLEDAPCLPQRTAVQLREFIDDIEEITGMSDQQPRRQEKLELYLDYYDAIQDVYTLFEKRWSRFADDGWIERLRNSLEDAGHSLDDWYFSTSGNDWGRSFTHGWHTHIETGEPLSGRAPNYNDARIMFHHRLERDRDDAIRDRQLKFKFRNCGSNDKEFRNAFNEVFNRHRDDIEDLLPANTRLTGQKRNKFIATYDIHTDGNTGFFDGYVDALHRAMVDLGLENTPLIELLDELFAEAFEMTYGFAPKFRK